MFFISTVQEARIRRQERRRAQKILIEFGRKAEAIQRKEARESAITHIRLGFCEGFSVGRIDPGLSREGFYTRAMTFANEKVDEIFNGAKNPRRSWK